MSIESVKSMMLIDLYKNRDGLQVYTLYNRYKKPVSELVRATDELINTAYIEELDEKIKITKKGVQEIYKYSLRREKIVKESNYKSRCVGSKIEIGEFYIPRRQFDN